MEPIQTSPLHTAANGCLARGGVVVTGNARAARSLLHAYEEMQRAAGVQAWLTPPVYEWESWLGVLWKLDLPNVADAPLLLTPLQEQAVWKKVAKGQAADSEPVATLAAKAYRLLGDFDAHGELQRFWAGTVSRDVEVFRAWAATFDRECRTNRWISRADLAPLLAESIRRGNIELPAEVLLVGFDRITPAQRAFLEAAKSAGVTVVEFEELPPTVSSLLVQAIDLRDELTTCAWWARRILEDAPKARIGIIAQKVDETRGEIERVFRQILMPESIGIGAADEADDAMPFEFSLGVPLSTVPVIKAALLLLRWLAEPLDQDAISWLMLSGFLAAEGEDAGEMAALDFEIRTHGQMPPEAPIEVFAQYRPRTGSQSARGFLFRLRRLQAEAEGIKGKRKTFPEWTDFAETQLRQARWPGSRVLESVEFQARQSWYRLIGEVAGLGFDGSRVTWSEFVTVLDRYSAEAIFAPESQGAPIQIMGALESAGQHFDALGFLGADDRQWPPTGQPNPLLPLWLQHNASMPHSSIEVDWELNLAITRRLAASATRGIFSHALRDETGELRPSALLAEVLGQALPAISSQDFRAKLGIGEQGMHSCLTVRLEDDSSIPWPREIPAGGAEILRRQSACAFQSFAVRRLGADELATAERGLNPLDRGNLLHKVMEAFWSKENPAQLSLKTRDDLCNAKFREKLPEILSFHIAEVFRKEFQDAPKANQWFQTYLQVERERLQSVLAQWLDYERGRAAFTVEEYEKKVSVHLLNGLQLDIRVDRIDQVEGGRFIVDYKTGTVAASIWEGERPDEPQLPLYATYGQVEDLRGVLFARVRAGDMKFFGRVEDAERTLMANLPKNSGLLSDPLNKETLWEWAGALSNLADQFLAGDAKVAPKQYPKTCKYCALPALCRVAETFIVRDIDDLEDSADGSGPVAPWEIAADD